MQLVCSKCEQEAVYLRRYTAEHLCRGCLVKTTVDRVRRTINKKQQLRETDRIVIAISGGKDSAVLLDVLYRIEQNFPRAELLPLTIDEGIVGYRDKALVAAKTLTDSLGLRLEVRSFKGIFGHSLDEIIQSRGDKSLGACSYCGVLRRRAINTAAKDLDADVIATGHNMDDEAQTVMMNVMRGDSRRIARTNRARDRPLEGFVPRVKPITELSERDIVAYAHHVGLPYHDTPCPYYAEAYRNDLRNFLNEMEYKRPGTLLAVLRSAEAITEAFEQTPSRVNLRRCEQCGEVTTLKVCKVCAILEELSE